MNKKRRTFTILGVVALFSITAFTVGGAVMNQDDEPKDKKQEQVVDESSLTQAQQTAQDYAVTGFDSTAEVLIAQLTEQFGETIETDAKITLDGGFTNLADGSEASVRSLKIDSIPSEFNNTGSLNFFLDKMQKLSGNWTATEIEKEGLVEELGGGDITIDDAVELYDKAENPELPATLSFIYTTDNATGLKTIYFTSSVLVESGE